MNWLQPDEFVRYAPPTIGAQVSVNHADCAAGRDTKRRLYVKRVARGIVAYCHHCGRKGAAFKTSGAAAWEEFGDVARNEQQYIAVGSELRRYERALKWIEYYETYVGGDTCETPQVAREWLRRKGFMEPREAAVVWGAPEDEEPGLILPIRSPDGRVVGVQVRRTFDKKAPGLRYETFLVEKTGGYIYGYREAPIVVVTEDYLSSIRLAMFIQVTPLYGSTMSSDVMASLFSGVRGRPDHVVVWLDNDKPEIAEAATKIAVKVEPFFDRVTVILHAAEPTKYTDAALKNILTDMELI